MNSLDIKDFIDFIKFSDGMDLISEIVIYRGQATERNLLPQIARRDPSLNTERQEIRALKELRYLGASLLPPNETDLDLMVRAQHYGLKTRLLDWTSNALAALWFACSDRQKGDTYVYALAADGLLADESVYGESPFRIPKTRVLRPRLNNERIVAQTGWFTLHRYAGHRKFIALENNAETKPKLTEFRIPAKKRPDILRSLHLHGVSARTLTPGLSGLCQDLNWQLEQWLKGP